LFVDSSGRVLVGTSTGSGRLEVVGVGDSAPIVFKGASTEGAYVDFYNNAASSNKFRIGQGYNTGSDNIALLSNRANADMVFQTNTTERLRITAAGLVGIGSTAPSYALDVRTTGTSISSSFTSDQSEQYIALKDSGTTIGHVRLGSTSGSMLFFAGNSERGRFDSSGRLLVGTSSAPSVGNGQYARFAVQGNTTGGGAGVINLQSVTASNAMTDGANIGWLQFTGNDGAVFSSIQSWADGTSGTNDYPGRLTFSTTADGASSPTERMRITQAGKICMGNSASSQPETLQVYALDSANGYCILANVAGTGTRTHIRFENGNGIVGAINTNGTTTSYLTSSDYRLKENVAPVQNAVLRLQQLKPCRFNFVADADVSVDGFIAHEVQEVVPEAIAGEKDAVDADGNPVYQGIDQSKLVPLLTAALQELVAEVESLKAEVAALKAQ
jgi:hypothetical protein